MRVLLDECVPKRLRSILPGHEVLTVVEMGWAGVKKRKLLALAAEHFECFLTVDANIEYQQNLPSIPVAILLVRTASNDLASLTAISPAIQEALASLRPKTFVPVSPNRSWQRSVNHKAPGRGRVGALAGAARPRADRSASGR